MSAHVPMVVYEDEHLLVCDKPAGWNTHAPSPFAGDGLYEWLRGHEPRWRSLSILHRLDKDTSGLIVFGKTTKANQSLTQQFTDRTVRKRYVLLSRARPPASPFEAVSALVRCGDRYVARPPHAGSPTARTEFRVLSTNADGTLIEAEPVTGRTHQIRVHAAAHGFPILGDTLYGGAAFVRLCLHARSLELLHPTEERKLTFSSEPKFTSDPVLQRRHAFIPVEETNAYRLVHGAADGQPDWRIDRLGEWLLSQSPDPLSDAQLRQLRAWAAAIGCRGIYHKHLTRHVRHSQPENVCPQPLWGEPAPEWFEVRENGIRYELSFREGYSVGLFLDQRENRRRLRTGYLPGEFTPWPATATRAEVLNCFAYTCGFSVCAALAGAQTTSLDLSRKYLEWGQRNFARNGLAVASHDFVYGDVFDWLRRWAKKSRRFDTIILDPPTFSHSKQRGAFHAESGLATLVAAALPLLARGGTLMISSNAARLTPEAFLQDIAQGAERAGRRLLETLYCPQPPDFPVARDEPAYFKSAWLRLD